jgi:hypothetical protein
MQAAMAQLLLEQRGWMFIMAFCLDFFTIIPD